MKAQILAATARKRSIKHEIVVSGIKCSYWEYPALQENARNLVFIHGYRGNHHGLEAIAGDLPDFNIYIPDLPGFGKSEQFPNRHTIHQYSTWLRDFLVATSLEKNVHIVGHSFGTLVVGKYACTNNPASLTLINPVSTSPRSGANAFLTALATVFYKIARLLPDSLGDKLLRSRASVLLMSIAMAKTKEKSLRKWIHKQHLDNFSDFNSVRVAVEGYQASVSSALEDFANEISSPVLVIATALDDITSIADQRRVLKNYRNAKLVEIEEVGHLTHYEAPEKAATAIREFVSSLL